MNVLKSIDFFGSFFHWYAKRQKKLYTNLGGILTIFSIIICGTLLAILFNDCLGRKNPQVTENEEINVEFKKIKFGEEKIYIPWTIADYKFRKVNITDWIYPVIYYFSSERDNETNLLLYKQKTLNYKYCNETNLKNINYNINKNVNFDEMFCIDMEDIIMGGDWFHDFIYNVKIDFFLCEDGADFGIKGKKCTDYDKLIENIGYGNELHVEIHYPEIIFKSENKEEPLQIFYNSHLYSFNKLNTKIERLYLKEFSLTDDKGWIFKDIKESRLWGYDKIVSDSYLRTSDFIPGFNSSKIYSLTIYINRNTKVFTRKYKKLLDALGDTLSIVNCIFIIFKYSSQFFTEASQDKNILETLFIEKNSMEEKYNKFNNSNKKIILLNNQNNFDSFVRQNFFDKKQKNEVIDVNNINPLNLIIDNINEINVKKKQDKFDLLSKFTATPKNATKINKKLNMNNNSLAKFNLNNSSNSNIKVDLQKKGMFNFKSNNEFSKKHFDKLKSGFKKSLEKEKKIIDKKKFSFPYYLYLLNIFNKIFAMNDMCCSNHKFTDAWKSFIDVFDIVNYIQMLSNVDLVNKILFEMKNATEINQSSFHKNNIMVHESVLNCKVNRNDS